MSGNTWPQSPQLVELLLTDAGLKSGISVYELISTLKKTKTKKKTAQAQNECMIEHSPKILASEEKAVTTIELEQEEKEEVGQ